MTLNAQTAFDDWSAKGAQSQRIYVRALLYQLAELHNEWSTRTASYGDDPETIGVELDTLARTACDIADLFPPCAKQ